MINCIIIDDDKVFTKILEHYISKVEGLVHLKTYHNGLLAYNEIDLKKVELIFLDMEMPEIHGLELLESLPIKPEIVFVSKSNSYGSEAFEYNAIDYLYKPVTLNRFLKCAKKITTKFNELAKNFDCTNDGLFIRVDGYWQKILFEDITIIKAENNKIIIKTNTSAFKTTIKFNDILLKLPPNDFMQVHRSYIVQLNKITKVDGEIIEINGKTIPVSKTYIEKLYKRLNLR